MNIYFREMRANARTLFFWCLGILAMVGGGMGKYSGFDASGQQVMALMDKMPKAVLAIFGMVNVDMGTAAGFYAVIYVLLLIMATLYAVMLGAHIIAKEEQGKTSEFLFVKPVSRKGVLSAKLLAALTNLILFNAFALLVSLCIGVKVAPDEDLTRYLCTLSLAMLITQLMFLFIGSAFVSISKKMAFCSGRVSLTVLIAYMLSVMIDMNEKWAFLKYLTPFKYFEARSFAVGGGFETVFLVLSGLILIVGVGLTYTFYPRRDLGV